MTSQHDLDELDRLLGPTYPQGAPVGALNPAPAATVPAQPETAAQPALPPADQPLDRDSPHYQPCSKCRGSGKFKGYTGRVLGDCYHCKGAGGFMRATTAAELERQSQSRAQRKATQDAETWASFAESYPQEAAWLESRSERFNFAASVKDAVIKYGDLTDRQMSAVRSYMLKDIEREQASQERAKGAEIVGADKLKLAFDAALDRGLQRPRLRFEGFTASLAPAEGKNAGAIYLKSAGGTYLGKIDAGKFFGSRESAAVTGLEEAIAKAMLNPVEAAIQYGRATATCSCCGRTLTDPASVEAGIGPICESNYGW